MSVSTRTQLALIYPYVGSNAGGFVRSEYGAARGSYWCRVSPVPGQESMLDAQSGISAAAVIELADEVPAAEHDLIVVDGVQWTAGPITRRRQQRALVLRVERSTEAIELPTGQAAPADPNEFLSGNHSDEDFSLPGDETIDAGGADAVFTETIDGGDA